MQTDLPIGEVLEELAAVFDSRHEAVLEAPPGAGKTTVVPLQLLTAPWLNYRKILVLEPRRVAARAAAQRMAHLLGEEAGQTVGYRIRLGTQVSEHTHIEVITEGILTRMLQDDPSLPDVAMVIFDEFHERHLHSDVGLALLLQARELFRDADDPLRILVMSATLDGVAVAKLLGGAPVVRSEGRQFPVDIAFSKALPPGQNIIEPVAAKVREVLSDEANGSVLVFLPGEGEIRGVMAALREIAGVVIRPMYGTLTLHDQQLAIEPAPEGQRKVVLATNVAESSLTIDGITTVVDGGLERAPQYDPGTGMSRLHTRRISQASATQRAGRAGRLAPGQCFRLWSEDQQAQLQAQTPPEILQADLSQTALQVLAWGVDAVSELAWLDEPPAGAWSQALDLLAGFGAIEKIGGSWRVTPEGEHMARLPAHPRLAHMLLQANLLGLREEAYQLAAILSERDPFRDQGADIELRLAVLDEQEACPRSLRGWRTRVQRQVPFFKVMCRDLPTGSVPQADIGSLIAIAYPDRIARRRQQKGNIYQLSNGRSARLDESDPLCNCEWLAVAELGGIAGRSEDRIYLAARLDPERFEDVLAGLVDSNEQVEWSDKTERFLAESQRRIGAIVLSRDPLSDVPAAAKQEALLTLVRERGLDLLPWSEELRQWQARVNLLYRELGPPWPDLSEQALLVSLEDWLGPYLDGVNKLADFGKLDLGNILQARLAWPLPRELEELAPQRFEVPSGSSIRIDYTVSPPVLAVKLQEMFGARETPAVARGKVPLVIHLLSPAKRPLQVTQDLVSFWQNGYAEVRKEMQGRYPKHPWPEDPLEAQATAKTKRHLK